MPSPADLLSLPGRAVGGIQRVLAEIILMRHLLERADARVAGNHDELIVHVVRMREDLDDVRRRVEELAEAVPTDDDDGPLTKVRKVLTEGPA